MIAYIILGSNLENRLEWLNKATGQIRNSEIVILQESLVYESEPWGFESTANFLNKVLKIKTDLSPENLLRSLLMIEDILGRKRDNNRYSSRNIDIDILFYENSIVDTDKLIIPHPKLHERRFTLLPMVEISPEFVHPVLNSSVSELLSMCEDNGAVKVYKLIKK